MQPTTAPSFQPILRAAALFFAFFTLGGAVTALGYPNPPGGVLFNVLTNLAAIGFYLWISHELDRPQGLFGLGLWPRLALVSVVAALLSEPICWIAAYIPPIRRTAHAGVFELQSAVQSLLTFLLWALVHVSIRSGERRLELEHRIRAVREAVLRDENEALLYALNPMFLADTLERISSGIRSGACDFAGAAVIELADHMRATLASRDSDRIEPPAGSAGAARIGVIPITIFAIWTTVAWLALLVVIAILSQAQGPAGAMRFLLEYGPIPVVGAAWCLLSCAVLERKGERPLYRMGAEAAGLCGAGLLVSGLALLASAWASGSLGRPYGASVIPGLIFYYMAPALMAWTAGYFVLDARRRETARLRSAQAVQEAALTARNAMLRQQLNPHFLFNALNALYALILDRQLDQAKGVIAAILRFLDRARGPDQGEFVPLANELAAQDAYLEIEKVRFGARLNVTTDVPAGLGDMRVPHLILQPLVENAVKYGVAGTDRTVTVAITAERCGEDLVLKVKDNGVLQSDARPPGLGVGLKNVEARLKSLYGERAGLACGPQAAGGFLAEVRMPVMA